MTSIAFHGNCGTYVGYLRLFLSFMSIVCVSVWGADRPFWMVVDNNYCNFIIHSNTPLSCVIQFQCPLCLLWMCQTPFPGILRIGSSLWAHGGLYVAAWEGAFQKHCIAINLLPGCARLISERQESVEFEFHLVISSGLSNTFPRNPKNWIIFVSTWWVVGAWELGAFQWHCTLLPGCARFISDGHERCLIIVKHPYDLPGVRKWSYLTFEPLTPPSLIYCCSQ